MFPVSTMFVSAIHVFPQLLILLVGALATGWTPDWVGLVIGLLGALIIMAFGLGLSLLFSAGNVFFRDFQNIVATFSIFVRWSTPTIYPFSKLATSSLAGTLFMTVYLANPISIAVLCFQRCFWASTVGPGHLGPPDFPSHLIARGFIMLAASLVFLGICQVVFSKFEGKFAERL